MSPEGPPPLWSTKQLAEYLGIGVQTVHSLRRRGEAPPAYRVGKVLRFDPAEVTAWLHERREDVQQGQALVASEVADNSVSQVDDSEATHV